MKELRNALKQLMSRKDKRKTPVGWKRKHPGLYVKSLGVMGLFVRVRYPGQTCATVKIYQEKSVTTSRYENTAGRLLNLGKILKNAWVRYYSACGTTELHVKERIAGRWAIFTNMANGWFTLRTPKDFGIYHTHHQSSTPIISHFNLNWITYLSFFTMLFWFYSL